MIKRNLPLMITLAVFVLGYLYCLTQFPGFASTRVICNILTDNAFLGIIAVGMTFVILSGGIAGNGLKGVGKTLKEFSLPISMSFRLFGALLSGLLVTELVYYYVQLSYVLPVLVGVLFTLLHALIQAYVLTMLTALFYGEVSERPEPASGRA